MNSAQVNKLVLTGAAAVGLVELIAFVQRVAIGGSDLALYLVPGTAWWRLLLAPAAGGLLVGVLQHHFGRESEGHGVPDVMEAVALRGGRIARRVVFTKAIASALAERDRHILVLANAALCGRKLIKDLLDDKAGDPAVAVACKQAFAELDAAGSLEYARSLPNA